MVFDGEIEHALGVLAARMRKLCRRAEGAARVHEERRQVLDNQPTAWCDDVRRVYGQEWAAKFDELVKGMADELASTEKAAAAAQAKVDDAASRIMRVAA